MSRAGVAKIWDEGTQRQLRSFVVKQDRRFQAAMRESLNIPPPAPPTPPEPEVQPQHRTRDVLRLGSVAHKLPMFSANAIIAEVCEQHRVTKAELFGHRREKMLVRARHEAFYRLKMETTLSLPSIGMRMGGKDHSTVHNGIAKHIARMARS